MSGSVSQDIRRYFEQHHTFEGNQFLEVECEEDWESECSDYHETDLEWEQDLQELLDSLKGLSQLIAMQLSDFCSKRLIYGCISLITGVTYTPPPSILPHIHAKYYYLSKRLAQTMQKDLLREKGFISLVKDDSL